VETGLNPHVELTYEHFPGLFLPDTLFVTTFQYAQEVQCISTEFNEKLNEDERNEMKLTGSVSLLSSVKIIKIFKRLTEGLYSSVKRLIFNRNLS